MDSEQTRENKTYKKGLSIALCCHNSTARLSETLAHLARQQVPEEISWEVVLVDNASVDNTSEVALGLWPKDAPVPLEVVYEPHIGLSHARHRGLLEAKYEFVGFIDDDNRVSPDWVKTAFGVMTEHPDVGACGGLNEPVCEIEAPAWFEKFNFNYAIGPQGDKSGYVKEERGFLWGAGLVIRKSAYQKLLDSGFYYQLTGRKGRMVSSGEDEELTLALRLAGCWLWYEPALKLKHFLPAERLKWKTLRRMHRAFGASTAVFAPYRYCLGPEKERFKKLWTKACLDTAWIIISEKRFPIKALLFSCEGDGRALGFEYHFGRFLEILCRNKRYTKSFNEIMKLKDRLNRFKK